MRGNGSSAVDHTINDGDYCCYCRPGAAPLLRLPQHYFSVMLGAGGCSKVPDERASGVPAFEFGDSESELVHCHCLGAAWGHTPEPQALYTTARSDKDGGRNPES